MEKIKLFDEIPVIRTGRLTLKRLDDADIPALLSLTENSRVYCYLPTFLFEKQYDDMSVMIRELYGKCFRSKESLILGVHLSHTGELCGLAEYYGYKESLQKTCIGYRFREEYWGQGIAAETVAAMIDYLFSVTDTEIITASTMPDNKASARCLKRTASSGRL